MKKIFNIGILLILLTVSSCVRKEPEKYIKKLNTRDTKWDEIKFINDIEYNNHKYIIFVDNFYKNIGTVHDPDCPCNKNKQ